MGINLEMAINKFGAIPEAFDKGIPHYLIVTRDKRGNITGCDAEKDRNKRASLLEINELAEICLNQAESSAFNPEALRPLQRSLEKIQAQIKNKERDFFDRIWFWLIRGNSILERTSKIIAKIAGITLSLTKKMPEGLEETLASATSFEKAKNWKKAFPLYYKVFKTYEEDKNYGLAHQIIRKLAFRDKSYLPDLVRINEIIESQKKCNSRPK